MKSMTSILILTLLSVLAGCATSYVAPRQATKAGADRIYAPKHMLHPFPGCAVLYVTRGNGTMMGSGVRVGFDIDNKPAASIWPGEKVEFFLKPSQHIIAFDHPGLRGSQVLMLDKGTTTIVSMGFGFMGSG